MKKKILKKKIIYGYVRCETKTCANKYKPLEVPKILIGKQQCQVCKNIMKKEDSKQIDAVYKLYDKSKPRVIDYVFKNFNIKKFNKIIDSYKEGMVDDFCHLILNCVDKYNPKYIRTGNEHEYDETVFLEYLGELLKTGVFFLQFKKYFKVEKYFESIVVEDTLWNEAYILLSKIDKKYRLILAHYGAHPGQDQIELISTKKKFDLNETLKELNNYNQQYHNIYKEIKLKGKGELLNAPDFKVCKPFMLIDAFHVAKNLEY